ncbi:hypothetical protein [Paraburkholderia sp. A1RO-5L]|uniref:hypothetical protein n=1 Tax=unclassified Paraburkholderia TaxID=2615204 RepID=UPI003B97E8D2
MADLHNRAEIVVLALHANDTIRKLCNKAIWLDHGRVQAFGPAEEIVAAYEDATV